MDMLLHTLDPTLLAIELTPMLPMVPIPTMLLAKDLLMLMLMLPTLVPIMDMLLLSTMAMDTIL